jgi:hypothetical protein
VVRLVTRIHLDESILHRGSKPEVIKLLVQLLSTLDDASLTGRNKTSRFPPHKCQRTDTVCAVFSELTQKSFKGYEFISRILGQTVYGILHSPVGLDTNGLKSLHEDVLRVIRSIGVLSICPSLLMSEMVGMNRGTSSMPLHSLFTPAAADFIADFALSLLLLYANAIVLMDKSNPAPSSGSAVSGVSSDSAGVGAGPVAGGRGRGSLRGGRGGNIRGSGLSASGGGMFRSTASAVKGRGAANSSRPALTPTGSGVCGGGSGIAPQGVAPQSGQGHGEVSDGPVEAADEAAAERSRVVKNFIHSQCAVLREVCLKWFVLYVKSLYFQQTQMETSGLRHRGGDVAESSDRMVESDNEEDGEVTVVRGHLPMQTQADMLLTRRRSDSNVSTDSAGGKVPLHSHRTGSSASEVNARIPSLIDWLQKVLCLHTMNAFRVSDSFISEIFQSCS